MAYRFGLGGLLVVVALVGCGGGSPGSENPGDSAAGVLIEHIVAPATTDSNIDNWLDDHYAYRDTRVAARNRLLVHLPGSFGRPVNSRGYLKEVAAAGDHVIGLRYPNTWEVLDLCSGGTDLSCFENVRREIIDGTDRSSLVAVNATNAIINRLTRLLVYLDQTYPAEGWAQFLSAGQPNWPLIAMSGHSQGAGHAAVMGKYYALNRVLMFGAPGDMNSNGIAPWQDRNHLTATAGYYGFNHYRDAWQAKLAVWTLIGLGDYGPAVNVDGVASPYGNSHMLYTDALPGTGSYDDAHGAVITDENTPLDPDGTPLYAPVWRYMCCS
jgi:hypothetical protein